VGVSIQTLAGWGRYPAQQCTVVRPERYREFTPSGDSSIARGQGRSYGDAAQNDTGHVILTQRINRFLELDEVTGALRAESGVTLSEVLAVTVPRGWTLPVVPGTQFASLGGCVAADVHGKNHHHRGSFGNHLTRLDMILANGKQISCSPQQEPALYWATLGGMGLTGLIGEVSLQLMRIPSAHMLVQQQPAENLDALFRYFEDSVHDDAYTVAWIDGLANGTGLGRGIYMRAHHAAVEELPSAKQVAPLQVRTPRTRRVPVDFPAWALNPVTVGLFNRLYSRVQSRHHAPQLVPHWNYFFPLDALLGWNRIYGKRGFVQYQCVLPAAVAHDGIRALLERISASRRASFLAVLKRLGPGNPGPLSFPIDGYTLAMDFPLYGAELFSLLTALDEIVLRYGGRVYLAKDARLSPETFRHMYPRYPEWLAVKQSVDAESRFQSGLSRRLRLGETG